jgi:prevent-host-death family protein
VQAVIVTATDFKNKVGIYLKIAQEEDVIITKNGKYAARLTTAGKDEHPLTESLIGVFEKAAAYDTDNIKQERLKKYESAD